MLRIILNGRRNKSEKNKSVIYVQILIHLGVAHITGWIHSKDLHKYDKESCEDIKIIHKCIGIPIAHLAPPSLLLSVLGTDLF